MNRGLKYGIGLLLLGFVAYNSVYFKKLDEVKAGAESKTFDATAYARNFFEKSLSTRIDSAVDIARLAYLLASEPDKAFDQYSNALAIGNIGYFLVHGQGTVISIDDDVVVVQVKSSAAKLNARIATEFVYGNAIRDASGLVRLDDFSNTSDLNSVSEKINGIIRNEVLPPFIASVREGNEIEFTGAVELNRRRVPRGSLEALPIKLSILK
jgi:hypothetical protein